MTAPPVGGAGGVPGTSTPAAAGQGDSGSSAPAAASQGDSGSSAPAAASQGGVERFIIPGRRFTESQAPVTVKRKQQRSVLTRMAATTAGPCSRLKWCMERRAKVKVYIRNFGRVRGVCSGYIVAFDKHWNLCLEDVDETYQKKIRRKSAFLGGLANVPTSGGGAPARAPAGPERRAPPPTAVERLTTELALLRPPDSRRSRRRPVFETAHRHVNQLFVRGDNVVLVAVAGGGGPD
ncbi:U7 snRNA-associated Sm-like protein LSm11 [Pollicipes pollicipes]|uniref:U7 snRNA-associated Sm-like protein LSm11 n=1 Tax=Pollicipes pollicipes TaxID=41117 RepID=UPI0018851A88|nr:U7 snRNA-associated Sm-like protein LSm11 [Pollicipes pollicipes]